MKIFRRAPKKPSAGGHAASQSVMIADTNGLGNNDASIFAAANALGGDLNPAEQANEMAKTIKSLKE